MTQNDAESPAPISFPWPLPTRSDDVRPHYRRHDDPRRDTEAAAAPWHATVRWDATDDGQVQPVGVELRRQDGQPITAREWRKVAIQAVIDEARARLRDEVLYSLIVDPDPDLPFPPTEEVESAVDQRLDQKRGPGRPRYWPDDHLRRVADAYTAAVRASSRHPVVDVRDQLDAPSTATAKGWVAAARRRGFIPSGTE